MNNSIKKITFEKNRILIYNPPAELNQSFISSLTEYSNYNNFAKKILFQAIKYIKLEDNRYVLCIPRFYPSKYLQQYFPDYIVEDNLNSEYNKFDTIELNITKTPRDYIQEDCIDYLHSRGDFYYTKKFDYLKVLTLQTGIGKTYCGIKYICDSGIKTIITTDAKTIFDDVWLKDLFEYTDIVKEDILEIKDSSTIKKYLKNIDKYKNIKIFLICNKTVGSLLRTEQNIILLQDFFKKAKIGLTIHDEAHKDYKVLTLLSFYIDVYKKIYMTATPKRTSYSADKVYQYILPSSNYWIGLKEEHRKNNHINFLFHVFDSKPKEYDKAKMLKKPGVNSALYSDYLMENGYDNILEQIKIYVDKMIKSNYRVVIICGKLEFIEKLKESLEELYPNNTIGEYTSRIKDKELKSLELKKDIIISTEKSLGAGIDAIFHVMINLVRLSSQVAIPQLAGRLRDIEGSPCLFIDMVDKGFIRIQQQFAKNKTFVKKELAKNLTVIEA